MRSNLAFVLIAVAAFLGIIQGRHAYRTRMASLQQAAAEATPDGTPPDGVVEERPLTPAERVEMTARAEEGRQALDAARSSFRAGDLVGASLAARAIEEGLADAAGPAATVREDARRLEFRCQVFHAVLGDVPRGDFADGRDLWVLRFADGEEDACRVLETGASSVRVRSADGRERVVPRSDVASLAPLAPDAWRQRMVAELREMETAAAAGNPYSFYQIAYCAAANGLLPEAVSYLERTMDQPNATVILQTFATGDPTALKYAWFMSEGDLERARLYAPATLLAGGPATPRYGPVGPGPSPGPGPGPNGPSHGGTVPPALNPGGETPTPNVPVGPVNPVSGPAAEGVVTEPAWSRAEASYRGALDHYRRSLPGSPNAEEQLRLAREGFDQARAILQDLYERYPDDPVLNERLSDVQLLLYDCLKRTGI